MKSSIALLLSVCLLSAACHTHKTSSTANGSNPGNANAVSTDVPQGEVYRVTVSFASRGTGINSEQRQNFLKYIDAHKKKPVYKTVFWGREGETDYCFKLDGWSAAEQAEFIRDVKGIVAGNNLIVLEENAPCHHESRR